jgi:glycosyltransferase involved in cell wall biosynthesis
MKILLVSTLYPPIQVGGAEIAASRLAEALVRQGHEVTAVTLHSKQEGAVECRNGVKVYREPLDNIYWPFQDSRRPWRIRRLIWHLKDCWNRKAARRFRRILDMEKPDVVHTHNITGFSVSVWREARKVNIPIVHTIHDYYLLCINAKQFRGGQACRHRCIGCEFLTRVRKSCSADVDAVVGVSSYTLRAHKRLNYFGDVEGAVVYNIAPVQDHRVEAPDKHAEDLVFGFIGRLSQDKGIEVLLQASRGLKGEQWRLRIAGTGDRAYVEKLQREYADPRIEWLGFIDPKQFYESVDVVVIPSVWAEPLPYVCVEALLAGKSMICADSGGIPEVASMGQVVTIVRPGDVDELTDALDEALRNLRYWRRQQGEGWNRLQVFREEQVLQRYLRIYESVV